ncbi:MAG: bifunctional demethylmenaquinone methyltransferase/2-methoxy-6-polyprenyl-1,4-benzoquinol methylase UbiE [Thermodesulfovibrionales bacterium]
MKTESLQRPGVLTIFTIAAPHIDFLSTALSLGLSTRWRRAVVEHPAIRKGGKILDVCTGTGELALPMAENLGPDGQVVGIDFCRDMLALAKEKARARANSHPLRVSFGVSDARSLEFPDDSFDAVTVAFGMRNIPDNTVALREIKRVLKPGGTFLCLELTRPDRRWFLPFYRLYAFGVMPRVGKLITRSNEPYSYLPASIFGFCSPEEFRQVIEGCGFASVKAHPMTFGVATIYEATKG